MAKREDGTAGEAAPQADRARRLAEALRQNLRRRKAQARARRAGGDGAPSGTAPRKGETGDSEE